jgi:alanine-synthesizing transaminase
MFLWAAIPERHRAQGSLAFAKQMLERTHVAVSPGIGFGPMGEGFVRFSLIENEKRLREAAARIGDFIAAD